MKQPPQTKPPGLSKAATTDSQQGESDDDNVPSGDNTITSTIQHLNKVLKDFRPLNAKETSLLFGVLPKPKF